MAQGNLWAWWCMAAALVVLTSCAGPSGQGARTRADLTATPEATVAPETTQPVTHEDDKRFREITGSLIEASSRVWTEIKTRFETTMQTISKQATETISGLKANTTALDQRFRDFEGQISNVIHQITEFKLDPEWRRLMETRHAAEMERQDKAHAREASTQRSLTLGFACCVLGILLLVLADNIASVIGWARHAAFALGFVLIAGGIAAMFFYDTIPRLT